MAHETARTEWWRLIPREATADARWLITAPGLRAFGDGLVSVLLPSYLLDRGFDVSADRRRGLRRPGLAVVACLGDDRGEPTLQVIELAGPPGVTRPLPGRPRWCVLDGTTSRVYCAIREPSLVLVAELPALADVRQWPLPVTGAHGLDLDPAAGRLYVACAGGELVAVDLHDGGVVGRWPLPGVPDATFVNRASGRVHVAVGHPGVVVSLDPRTGRTATCPTAPGAKTTALVPPDRLYAFSASAGGAIELVETAAA